MANAEYRSGTSDQAFRPYIGAGVSIIQEIDFDEKGRDDAGEFSDRGDVVFQLMAGADYSLNRSWSLNAGLRHFDAGSVTLDGDGDRELDADYRLTSLLLGVRYSF
ncbi:MAG: OmpW family outer membrane protein [Pseudomonadota bacterium]